MTIEENEFQSEDLIRQMLIRIGDDPTREGLLDTPKRVVKSWNELYMGYQQDPKDILKTAFTDGACDEMVISKNISFMSHCEHHVLPFYGVAHFGYLPNKTVVGLSKITRLIDVFARRLQIQEKLTTQIVDSFMEIVKPHGCMLVMEAHHMCMSMRGVKRQNSLMTTSAIRGSFKHESVRNEFLSMIKG